MLSAAAAAAAAAAGGGGGGAVHLQSLVVFHLCLLVVSPDDRPIRSPCDVW